MDPRGLLHPGVMFSDPAWWERRSGPEAREPLRFIGERLSSGARGKG